jgi:hypothetical protein
LDISPARLGWVLTTAATDFGTFGGTYQKGVDIIIIVESDIDRYYVLEI